MSAAISAREFAALDIPKPVSILGEGIIEAGGYALLHGDSGIGKSQVMVRLALDIATGRPFFGLETTGVRSAIASLELGDYRLQERVVRASRAAGLPFAPDSVTVLRTSVMGFHWDLAIGERVDALTSFIEESQIGFFVFDPLNRIHSVNENSNEDAAKVLEIIHRVRHRTGCAIFAIHHDGKPLTGPAKRDHRHAYRGASRWRDDAQCVMHLEEKKGVLRLTTHKSSHTGPVDPIWLALHDESDADVAGAVHEVTEPDSGGSEVVRRRDAIVQVLFAAYPKALSREATTAELAARGVVIKDSTLKNDLSVLAKEGRIVSSGRDGQRRAVYSVVTSAGVDHNVTGPQNLKGDR